MKEESSTNDVKRRNKLKKLLFSVYPQLKGGTITNGENQMSKAFNISVKFVLLYGCDH
jgi:predicted Mrr-cat superfamily restriction endonuclease